MNGKWASFILLFLSTLILGVLATDFQPKPVSAILISALYVVAYAVNSVIYGLDLFRKEQRLLHRVGFHGIVFFRGSEIESSEREKAEKLFIRQTTSGDMGRFAMGLMLILCLAATFLIRKKAPDQLHWATAIHFISLSILAVSFSMNHYFLSLAVNACAVFISVSQRIQDPMFSFFQGISWVFILGYVIFLFGFTGVFYRFLEFFQFGFELKNVRKLMKQGWLSGILFLVTFLMFNALVPEKSPSGSGKEGEDKEQPREMIKLLQSMDQSVTRWARGSSGEIMSTTTTTDRAPSSVSLTPEQKVIQGLKKSLERQTSEMEGLRQQMQQAESTLEKLNASGLASGETQEKRFQKVQELQVKIQALQGELASRESRVVDLRKHLNEKDPQGSAIASGVGADSEFKSGGSAVTPPKLPPGSEFVGVDPEKERLEIEAMKKKLAEIEAAQALAKAEAERIAALRRAAEQRSSGSGSEGPEVILPPADRPEEIAAKLEAERQALEDLENMQKAIREKEARLKRLEQELKAANAQRPAPPPELKTPVTLSPQDPGKEVIGKFEKPPKREDRMLTDAQLEMALKLVKIIFFGGLLIGAVFGLIYYLNRKNQEGKDRKIYQAVVEDPERYQKELRFLDQKGLSPQQEVILKYNLFLRFLKSVHLAKEDWQTIDQFQEMLSEQKTMDPEVLSNLGAIFGRVCYGGYRPEAEEVSGFRESLETLIREKTLHYKRELTERPSQDSASAEST